MSQRLQRSSETIKFLTPDELGRLLKVIEDKRDRALFLLAYRHGLRASEVGMLQTSDVDFKQLHLHIHRVKGSVSGVHPLRPDEVRHLKSYIRNRTHDSPTLFLSRNNAPISRITLHWLIRKYGELARLPKDKQHFHTLRHSIAVDLYNAGADARFVQDWLGHANIQNTVIYTPLAAGVREEKARSLFMKLSKF